MISSCELELYIDRERLREVLQRFVRARRLLDALGIVEAERRTGDGPPPAAMAAAIETIDDWSMPLHLPSCWRKERR